MLDNHLSCPPANNSLEATWGAAKIDFRSCIMEMLEEQAMGQAQAPHLEAVSSLFLPGWQANDNTRSNQAIWSC
jgi:hypothetical protein